MRKKMKENSFGIVEGQKDTVPTLNAEQVNNDFLKIKLYETKLKNNLLGEFLPNGEYKITDEKIIAALINIPKKYSDKNESFVYASTIIDNVVLNFKIEMNISESYCNANLSIIEVEHGVEEDIKHVTRLDNFVDVYSPKFKENVYRRWKVYFEEDVYEKDDFLKNYLSKMKEEFLFNKELTAILSQLYVVRMLKLLGSCGELGEKVKLEYKLLVEKILNKDASITQDYTRLKNILDYVIIKNKALPVLLKIPEALVIMQNYSAPIQRIKDKTLPPRVTEVQGLPDKKEEKKEEKKKSAPAKKKAKAKSSKKAKPYIYDFKNFKSSSTGSVKGFTYGAIAAKTTSTEKPVQKEKEIDETTTDQGKIKLTEEEKKIIESLKQGVSKRSNKYDLFNERENNNVKSFDSNEKPDVLKDDSQTLHFN